MEEKDNFLSYSYPIFSEVKIDYSLEDVLVNKKDIYNCSICLQIKPVLYQCYNGHMNCFLCWINHLKTNKTCPVCRLDVTLQTLAQNLALKLFLSQEMMKCPYSNLCENMNYGTFIDKHSRECEYRSIKCQCSVIMKFNEFENHQKQCPKSKISCPHCQTVFVRDSNHLETCDEMNISCHQCKTKIKRKEITDHIRDVCPETMTTCPLKYLGCGGSFFKKDKMAHLKSDQHINVCMDISDQPVFMTTLERGTFETKFQFLGINSSFSYQHGNQVLDITFDNLNDQPFAKDYDFRISIYDKNNNILDPGDKYCLSEITGILSRHKQNQAFQSIKLTIFKKNQSPQKI